MRLLFLTILAVSAVIRYGSCSPNKKLSSQSMLGRALLRRALEAMSNRPRINIKRRSLEEEEPTSGDDPKQTDAVEDIVVGSGSRSEEQGDISGTRQSEVNEDQSSGSEEQPDDSENSAESSGDDDGAQTYEQTQGQETKGDAVETSGQEEADKTEDQQEDKGVSSGGDTSSEAASETQTASPASVSSDTSSSEDSESGSEPNQETKSNSDKTSPSAETTAQVAKTDNQTKPESKKIASDREVKKSTIARVQPSLVAAVAEKEDPDTSVNSSGESDEVTSDNETTSGESSGTEEDGSTEAIRKGMESLSKLLKPVANGMDFQLFSGAAKPEDEEEEEDEEEKPVSKAESKGESDKAEEIQEEKPRVVKVKKCETKCALPMTYDQCAVPRCDYKMGTIKDLCIYLCKHQKPVCKQECKEVE